MHQLSTEQQAWIKQHVFLIDVIALAGDAGFRRYFRLLTSDGSYIFMDASAEPPIYRAFTQQSEHLRESSLPIPHLIAQNDQEAWAILEDFGDDLLFHLFQAGGEDALVLAERYYKEALDHLIVLHQHPVKAFGRIAELNASVICEELFGWQEWCLQGLFQQEASTGLNDCYEKIVDVVTQQPYVFMHRDFHSKNILRKSDDHLGIIDHQDAMYGPVTYDLASLLRDCYVDWPENHVVSWVLYYKKRAQTAGFLSPDIDDATFLYWFDWTSIQRHLKALFTFSRKSLRDNNNDYLQFIPRTLRYLDVVSSRYMELQELTHVIQMLREKI